MHGYGQHPNGLVHGVTSKHFGDLNWENIRIVHYRTQVPMDLLFNEALKPWNEVNVEAQCLTTQRLANIVNVWFSKETYINLLDMWERNLKLDLDPHQSRECEVFNDDVHAMANNPFTDSNLKYNLRIDLVLELSSGEIHSIVWSKAKFPIHQDRVILRFGIRLHVVHSWRLRS